MNFEGPLADPQLIRELYGAYSDTAFQNDTDAWLQCWAEDCEWVVLGVPFRGKAALRQHSDRVWAPLSKVFFFSEVGGIWVDGDQATARSYTRETMHFRAGGSRELVGRYDDSLVRETGRWRFTRRIYSLLADSGEGGGALPGDAR